MKKNIAENPRKNFDDPAVQKAWEEQMVMYGALLEPAFAGDEQTRLEILEVLQQLDDEAPADAAVRLLDLRDACHCDADRAAWEILMGLCMEECGRVEEAMNLYEHAKVYHHRYCYPYMRLSDACEQNGDLDRCEENIRMAMDCLTESTDDPYFRKLLAKLSYNLGFCYLMMLRFDDARQAMTYSEQLEEDMPGRVEGWAMLAAVSGDREELEKRIREAEHIFPERAEIIREQAEGILRGEDAYFSVHPVDGEALQAFWDWVWVNRQTLLEQLRHKESRKAFYSHVSHHLQPVFPFTELPVEFAVASEDGRLLVFLQDCYHSSVHAGLQAVIDACPPALQPYLDFTLGE